MICLTKTIPHKEVLSVAEQVAKCFKSKLDADDYQFGVLNTIQNEINQAAAILRAAGCSECYVFGSIADGRVHENSDIDIAVRGLPPEKFYYVYGQLSGNIDLVDLDDGSRFSQKLQQRGAMIRVF